MNRWIISFLILITVSCTNGSEERHSGNFNSPLPSDSLLVDIVCYIDKLPDHIQPSERFEKKNRSHFLASFQTRHRFVNYYYDEKGQHYFLDLVTVPSMQGHKRLWGGTFTLSGDSITEFTEELVSQKLPEETLLQIKDSLFNKMIRGVPFPKSWVEWPNETTVYDPKTKSWAKK